MRRNLRSLLVGHGHIVRRGSQRTRPPRSLMYRREPSRHLGCFKGAEVRTRMAGKRSHESESRMPIADTGTIANLGVAVVLAFARIRSRASGCSGGRPDPSVVSVVQQVGRTTEMESHAVLRAWISGMTLDLVHPLKARPGDRIAVLSPSFAAAGAFPAVHEQAMRRLTEVTGLIPVEYPTTRACTRHEDRGRR